MDDDERWRPGGVLAWSWWCGLGFLGAGCTLIVSRLLSVVVCGMVVRRGTDEQKKASRNREQCKRQWSCAWVGMLCASDMASVFLIRV